MSRLQEIRWHGRGGQGAWTASELLAKAAILEGKCIQSFPEFGPERSGAPVRGFTRISDEPISIHSQIYNPNIVVVVDPTLISANVAAGLAKDGTILANTELTLEELETTLGVQGSHVYAVNAKRIALDVLGRPIYNTAMLGALLKVAPLASFESASKVILLRFPGTLGEKNVQAMKRAYTEVAGK